MIKSKLGQRLIGLLLVAIAVPATVYLWHLAVTTGYYHPKGAALFPAIAMGALGVVLFPIDHPRLEREHGVARVSKFAHLPPVWKVWFFVALGAGLGNWYAIAHWAGD